MPGTLNINGLEKEADLLNLITIPFFVNITSLTLTAFSRHSINVRRALKRYDAQQPQHGITVSTSSSDDGDKPVTIDEQQRRNRPTHIGAKEIFSWIASTSLCLFLLAWWTSSFDASPTKHLIPCAFGVAASHIRPFSSWLVLHEERYVRRSKAPRKNSTKYSIVLDRISFRTNLLPFWAESSLKIIRPIAFGLIISQNGLLIPTIYLLCRGYWSNITSTHGASLRQIVLAVSIPLAAFVIFSAIAISVILSVFGGNTTDEGDPDANKPSSPTSSRPNFDADILDASWFPLAFVVFQIPIFFTVAAALDFDLYKKELSSAEGGAASLEEKIALARDDPDRLVGLQAVAPVDEPYTHPDASAASLLGTDNSGKSPEAMNDANSVSFGMLSLTAASRQINGQHRSGLELPTWQVAVQTFHRYARFLLVLATLTSVAVTLEPGLRAYTHPVMHPIGLHRLLFCRTSACVSPEDLTGGKWSGHGDEARTVLMLMSMVVFLLGWVLTVLAVLVSAWRRYGWEDGVKAIWNGADHGWSYPHAGWANEAPSANLDVESSAEEGGALPLLQTPRNGGGIGHRTDHTSTLPQKAEGQILVDIK